MYEENLEEDFGNEKMDSRRNNAFDSDFQSFPDDQVRYSTEIDSKLITSGYKKNEFKVKTPVFEEEIFGIPYLDKNGKKKLVNGVPVLRCLKKIKYFVRWEEKPFPLPVDLHNDSVTSSILEPNELSVIRMIDVFDTELSLEYVADPNANYSTSIPFFAEIKASIIESSKGKFGRMAELAKTQINKGEQRTWDYNQQTRDFDEFNARKNKKGLFGLGYWIF